MTPKPNQESNTPETDAARLNISCDDSSCGIYCHTTDDSEYTGEVCRADRMAEIERQLAEARELLATEKEMRQDSVQLLARNAEELRQAREENARLREALEKSKEFVRSWGELIDTQYPLWNECMTTIQKALTP